MADVVDPATRSRMMAAVRSRDTSIERLVRRQLHRRGFRFRLHVRSLPGAPDIVLPRYRAVVFVHGCFWHQHAGCRLAALPATNRAFWVDKLQGNAARDRRHLRTLRSMGWRPFTVWQCVSEQPSRLTRAIDRITKSLHAR